MSVRVVLFGAVICAAVGGSAHAERWIISVGARASASPPYEGADHSSLGVSPTFSLAPASAFHRYNPPGDGTRFALIDNRRITVGPMVRFHHTREPEGALVGLNKVKRAVEPGGFLDLWPADWLRVHTEVRRGVTGHSGWLADGGLDVVYSGERWDASVGPRVGFGDQRYMQSYFGVTPAEAIRSPFIDNAYDAGRGRRYTGVQAGLAYDLDAHWRTKLDASYHRLATDAAQSPIVRQTGSRDQYSLGIGVSYSFGVGRPSESQAAARAPR